MSCLDESLVASGGGEVELEPSIGSEEGFEAGLKGGVEVNGKVDGRVRSFLGRVGSLAGVPLLFVLVEPYIDEENQRRAPSGRTGLEKDLQRMK